MEGNEPGYHFADLTRYSELIEEIRRLESRMKSETGSDITLIAFTLESAESGRKTGRLYGTANLQ